MREIVLKKLRIRIRSDEIYKVCQMLDIPQEQIGEYFFNFTAQKKQEKD